MKRLIIPLITFTFMIFVNIYWADARPVSEGMKGAHGPTGSQVQDQKAWLGVFIQNITPELSQYMGLSETEGVLISDVASGGPAEAAGIKREDIIKAINGKKVRSARDVLSIISKASPGDTVTLRIVRKGKESSVKVRLASMDDAGKHGMMDHERRSGMMEPGSMTPEQMGRHFGAMMGQMMQGMMKSMREVMSDVAGKVRGKGSECPWFFKGMKGYGLMSGHRGYGMTHHRGGLLTQALIEKLQLTDKQVERIKEIERDYQKESIRLHSDIKIAKIDLNTLLDQDNIDLEEVKTKLQDIEKSRTELSLQRIMTIRDFRGLLTKEQRERFKSMGCFE